MQKTAHATEVKKTLELPVLQFKKEANPISEISNPILGATEGRESSNLSPRSATPLPNEEGVQSAAKIIVSPNSNTQALAEKEEIKSLLAFLRSSPTSFHAGISAKEACVENGFTVLEEGQEWNIAPGGKYFVARDYSSYIAFVMPSKKPASACILGAHTDSPGLKLKPNPEKKVDNATLLCTETYGGLIGPSWMGRSLGLAGKIIYVNEQQQEELAIIDLGKTIGTIPYLAVHLDRTQKEKVEINFQDHLPAVCWLDDAEEKSESPLNEELKKIVPLTKLLTHELFLIPREEAEIVNGKFIHSPRLDNLLGTHASLYALLSSQKPEESQIKMVASWDHEEVGSRSHKGAASNFLKSVLERIGEITSMTKQEMYMLKSNSGLISIDVAHGRHPNYVSKHEPNHAPLLGKGPVIKTHYNQSYGTTPDSAAWIYKAGRESGVPIQEFCTRSDVLCGSTIGNIVAPDLGIATVDIGAPVWEMHAIKEMGSVQDHLYMCKLLTTLLSMKLQ